MAQQEPDQRPRNLIEELLANPVEPAYAAAHERRRRDGEGPAPARRAPAGLALVATLVLIGLVLVAGYQSLREDLPADAPRAQLAARLHEEQDLFAEEAAALDREQRAVEEQQGRLLREGGSGELAAQVEARGVAAAATPVTGAGLVLQLDDAPGPDPEQRVVAADLQRLSNLLWASGAQAVSINGHRLSALAGIRFAGQALVVDFRALDRPYTVEAVGPDTMPDRFAELGGQDHLRHLRDEVGLRTSSRRAADLTVPADPTLTLHHARPVTVETP